MRGFKTSRDRDSQSKKNGHIKRSHNHPDCEGCSVHIWLCHFVKDHHYTDALDTSLFFFFRLKIILIVCSLEYWEKRAGLGKNKKIFTVLFT